MNHFGSAKCNSGKKNLVSQARIERIAQPIADKVIAQNGNKDRKSGKYSKPPCRDITSGIIEDASPGHNCRRHSKAEKRKCSFGKNSAGDSESRSDQHRSKR